MWRSLHRKNAKKPRHWTYVWVALTNGEVTFVHCFDGKLHDSAGFDITKYCTHWMPISYPKHPTMPSVIPYDFEAVRKALDARRKL